MYRNISSPTLQLQKPNAFLRKFVCTYIIYMHVLAWLDLIKHNLWQFSSILVLIWNILFKHNPEKKKKILIVYSFSSFPNLYEFLSSVEHKEVKKHF